MMKENVGTKCKSKLIPVAKIHTACLILTNFNIKNIVFIRLLFLCRQFSHILSKSKYICTYIRTYQNNMKIYLKLLNGHH